MVHRRKTELVSGLDLGSTALRLAVGKCTFDASGRPTVQIVGAAEALSAGVAKGVVVNLEEAISAISQVLEEVELQIGLPVEHAWVGITGSDILCQSSHGVVSVAKADGEISVEDKARAIEAARTIAVPLNYDILHVLPKSYTVDGQSGIRDPVGMTGLRLEVDTQIIHGVSAHQKNIEKAVYRAGIDIDDVMLAVLATGQAVTTPRQRQLGVAVANLGGTTTSLAVYEEGDVLHAVVLPIGSDHITNDLSIGLRCAVPAAERVKRENGYCLAKRIPRRDKLSLQSVGGGDEVFSRHFIAAIIEARATEILEKINDELGKVNRRSLLPAGIIFTGGGAKLDGLVDLAKMVLGLPVALGYPIDIPSVSQYSNDLAFSSAIGLVKWGSQMEFGGVGGKPLVRQTAANIWQQLRRAVRWLMP